MQTIDRAIHILDIISAHPEGISVSELSFTLNLSLGTTHRFLKSLMANNLVIQDKPTKYYRLGFKLLRLASTMLNANRLIDVARMPMRKAAHTVSNVVYLCQEYNGEVLCTHCEDSTTEVHSKFAAQIGNDMPFYAAAAAKIIFAYQSNSVLRQHYKEHAPLIKFTSKTKTSLDEIFADYQHIVSQGYAVCDEELENNVIAVAAPVFNYEGHVIASIGVTGIKANVNLDEFIKAVCTSAKAISKELGYNQKFKFSRQ